MALNSTAPVMAGESRGALAFDFNLTPAQLKKRCTDLEKKFLLRIAELERTPLDDVTFENTFLEFDRVSTQFSNDTNVLSFMKEVHTDPKVRETSMACSERMGQMFVELYAREALYRVLKTVADKNPSLSTENARLMEEMISRFRRNGLELPLKERKVFIKKRQQIVSKQEVFQKRVRDMTKTFVLVDAKELDGMPKDYIEGLKKTKEGKYKIGMDKASVFPFLENARAGAARKRVDYQYNQLGGPKNVEDFEKIVELRHETALMLNYKSHAHYVLDRRMAKTPENVDQFLEGLVKKLHEKGQRDLMELRALKKEEEPTNPEVHSWDWRYYENQWRKKKFQLDSQKIREYFPIEHVMSGMFDIYQKLLGVQFVEEKSAPIWHPQVKAFRVKRKEETVAFFYVDLFPREGKYNHFAAFDLILGHEMPDGTYRTPVAAIVGNFTPPGTETPSLLEHGDVETLFHEFGHIMHQTLTKAKVGTFSGANVLWDFVEAPSQMLENWPWQEEILKALSSHYKTGEKLPSDIIQRMIQAKNVNSGIGYLRQAAFARIDLTYHTAKSINGKSTKIYRDLIKQVMLIPIQQGTIPQAGFGHLVGGYDSGYYGYLYSKVYAEDMFTRFLKDGLLNAKTGEEYRQVILESGGSEDPMKLVTKFLGRPPSDIAFLKSLGL